MSLSLREKQSLYHSLGQLLRSGIPFPSALASLARTAHGAERRLVERLKISSASGHNIAESFARERPAIGELELGILSAVERTGRLERGLAQLAAHFEGLARARAAIWKRAAYPLFVVHFGVIVFALPALVTGGGLYEFLRQTLGQFALLYGISLVIALAIPLLRDAAAKSAALDALLRLVPLIGKRRRAFATSRFCATYEMQLDAGINVLDALDAAQRAAQSGLVRAAVQRAIPEVRNGAQVGPQLASSRAFPEPMIRGLCVGEETGELEQELTRLAADYQAEGLARLDTLAEWIPRLLYIAVLITIGYSIVAGYQKYLGQVQEMTNGM